MPAGQPYSVETRGIGKPDYSKEVSAGRQRAGISLKYGQIPVLFGRIFSPVPSPIVWVASELPPRGTHTGGMGVALLTDAAAHFPIPNGLVGQVVHNVTDGSFGTITANTLTTITAVLVGGTDNLWDTGDEYLIGVHLIDSMTGDDLPFTVPAGYFLTWVELYLAVSQDCVVNAYIDGFLMNNFPIASGLISIENMVTPVSTEPLGTDVAHTVDFTVENIGGGNMLGGVRQFCILEPAGTTPLPDTKTIKCKFCGHRWTVPRGTAYANCPKCGELNIYLDLSKFRRSS